MTPQLQDHLKKYDLFKPFQSGVLNGTGAAMVEENNDLLSMVNVGLLSILILLDLSD